ncbi:protein WVD2-like 7 [Rutidosis leptorrhynchoides]|uniref:protein WVD2-like 7 n=1 Tax=Rutidosis leptorrhynchoides TaxID=125765 RepID=UPI003A995340
MSGEIEEPLRLNFQADLLHSGSISFGRFESESLSWERRSIFSHNRYLEEVEKYSKPGSVTEKKAYFEAEFRRKALLRQQSSECQDGGEGPTSSNGDHHDFEGSGNGNESSCSSHSSLCNVKTEIQSREKRVVEDLNAVNGDSSRKPAWFDEIPHNSGYDEEFEDIISQEFEGQTFDLLHVTTQEETVSNMVDSPVTVSEPVKNDETHQSETETLVANTEKSIGATHIDTEMNDTSEVNDSSVSCQTIKKNHNSTTSGPRTTFFPKVRSKQVKSTSENKVTRVTTKTQPNIGRSQNLVSNEAFKGSMKPKTNETKSLHVKKTEKKLPRPTCTGIKTSKAEDDASAKEKELQLRRSIVKDLRSEKTVNARIPFSKNPLPGVIPTINRPKQTNGSSKGLDIQNPTGFSFKTGQRAENRKEFYMEIAEKMHAKEAETNQVDVKKQEKQAAEMKQFRKSLVFKAKPMPSFYNESTRGSDQYKVTQISKTTNQPQPSLQSTITRRNNNAYKSLVPSNIRPSSATPSTNRIRLSDSVGTTQPRPSSPSMSTRRGPVNTYKSPVTSNVRPSSATPSTNRILLSDSVGTTQPRPSSPSTATRRGPVNTQKSPVTSSVRPSSATPSTNRIRLSDNAGTTQPRPSSPSMATRRGPGNPQKSSVTSNVRPSSATPSANRIRLSESVARNHTPVKKQNEREPRVIDMYKKHAKGIHLGKSANLAVF